MDCADKGVRINAVCPTWVRTPLLEKECRNNPAVAGAIQQLSPLSRAAEVEEITGAILFLCGSSAGYVTGTGLVIDTGMTLTVHMS